ncbi:hypothetical protein CAEBREN_07098 [Caenorhabditis brenneri]|uniref:Uncharacterized protein n=1 Tax=Caenorhabditis brenneri TaxID=135651 RepID=G0P0A8_CAEBE|nr:hypothetical protein CAEBREN_07098 [Caenorhabditis brenneri]
MYISNPPKSSSKTTVGDVFMFIFFVVFPVGVGLFIFFRHLRHYLKSFKHHSKTTYPQSPIWLNPNAYRYYRENPINEEAGFLVHRASFKKRLWMDKKGKTKEKDKLVMVMMRRLLEGVLGREVQCNQLPDTTTVISIPKRSFKSTAVPGTFTLKVEGPMDPERGGRFEYQMIGDNRIQVVFYVTNTGTYVAGICIYIEDPYQSIIHYRESIVKKFMNSPEYWPKDCMEEETMEILRRKNSNKSMVLQTKNRYGEMKQWIYHGDSKSFKPIKPKNASDLIQEDGSSLKILSKFFSVKMCQSQKKIVMILVRDGEKMHAEWNKNTRFVNYTKCETCNEPDDVQPPSYHSIQKNE